MKIYKILTISITLISSTPAIGASNNDVDKLTTYAVMLGRALACGVNTKTAASKVGYWMDRVFPPGSEDQITYLPIFLEGIKHNAEQQSSGNSPDSCSDVKRSFNAIQWP